MLLSGHLALCRRRTIVPDAGLANPQFLYPVVIQQIQGTCRHIHRFIFVFTILWCPAFLPPVLSAKILLEADSGQREAGRAWEERGKRDYMGAFPIQDTWSSQYKNIYIAAAAAHLSWDYLWQILLATMLGRLAGPLSTMPHLLSCGSPWQHGMFFKQTYSQRPMKYNLRQLLVLPRCTEVFFQLQGYPV